MGKTNRTKVTDLCRDASPGLNGKKKEVDLSAAEELVIRLLNLWEIHHDDRQRLLGRDTKLPTNEEFLERVGYLLAIHKCLRLLYPKSPEICYSWIRLRNEAFDSKTPLEIFLERGVEGMKVVAGYLWGIVGR